MRRRLIALLSACLLLCAADVALAANPQKGGRFTGTRNGKQVTLTVAANGRTATARLYCSGQHSVTVRDIAIQGGRFRGELRSGSTRLWSVTGRFTSPTTAQVRAGLYAICDGVNVSMALTLDR